MTQSSFEEAFVTITRPSPQAETITFRRTKPRPEVMDSELRVSMPSDAELVKQEPLVELVDGIWRRRRP